MATYKVIAYRTEEYTMIVDAASMSEALEKAAEHECVSDEWQPDYDSFNFTIDRAEEIDGYLFDLEEE